MFEGLVRKEDDDTYEKILLSLLDIENVEPKTEIDKPLNLTRLDVLSFLLKNEKMIESSRLIDTFIYRYLAYQISKKRQGRKEIITAIAEGIKQEKSLTEKLTTRPGG